jgi:hypothetical protein
MLCRERLAAMPIRSTNPTSKKSQGGAERRWKVLCFKVDNKSIQSERGKAFFKSNETKLECL